jgi:hypothetical protein
VCYLSSNIRLLSPTPQNLQYASFISCHNTLHQVSVHCQTSSTATTIGLQSQTRPVQYLSHQTMLSIPPDSSSAGVHRPHTQHLSGNLWTETASAQEHRFASRGPRTFLFCCVSAGTRQSVQAVKNIVHHLLQRGLCWGGGQTLQRLQGLRSSTEHKLGIQLSARGLSNLQMPCKVSSTCWHSHHLPNCDALHRMLC